MSNGINKTLKRRDKAKKFNDAVMDELAKAQPPKRKRSVIAVHAALIARRKR